MIENVWLRALVWLGVFAFSIGFVWFLWKVKFFHMVYALGKLALIVAIFAAITAAPFLLPGNIAHVLSFVLIGLGIIRLLDLSRA